MTNKIKYLLPAIAALAVAPFAFADDAAAAPATPPAEKKVEITPAQRTLFLQGIGWLFAQQSGLAQELRISAEDAPIIAEGFKLALLGDNEIPKKIVADSDAYTVFVEQLQEEARAKIEAEMEEAAAGNKALGAKFVADTKAKDKAYKELPSGVLIKTVKAGDEKAKPAKTNSVKVRYTGKLIDGSVFDSSTKDENGVPVPFVAGEGETVEFPLFSVIKGWTEAIPEMGVGGVSTIIIPAESAYGNRAIGAIPPGSTLIFDVELVDIMEGEDEEAEDLEIEDVLEDEEDEDEPITLDL